MLKKTTCILMCAGESSRMFSEDKKSIKKSKVLLELIPEVSIFLENLLKFNQVNIDSIVVVCREEDRQILIDQSKNLNLNKEILFTDGGKSRAESVKNGLSILDDTVKVVSVHDCARPFFSIKLFNEALARVSNGESLVFGSKITSTLKESDNQFKILRTISRHNIWDIQTPQIFPKEVILKAYELDDISSATDDSELVERTGIQVNIIESPRDNIKVTLPEDFEFAKYLYLNNKKQQNIHSRNN